MPRLEPHLKKARVFVEIAGGLNYISCIVKNKYRDVTVCATDISPQYLQKKSIPLSRFFDIAPDYYLALDAENMPFLDNSIDILWTHASMHHFKNVGRFLSEATRVLTPTGVLVGMDTARPILGGWHYLEKKSMMARQEGIFENAYSYRQWRQMVRGTSFSLRYISFNKSGRLRQQTVCAALNGIYPVEVIVSNLERP